MEFDHVTNQYLYPNRYIKMMPFFLMGRKNLTTINSKLSKKAHKERYVAGTVNVVPSHYNSILLTTIVQYITIKFIPLSCFPPRT
jgi:hypothetical protein